MNPTTFAVVPEDSRDVQLYAEFTALKSKGVKTWIAVGGYDFSNTNMPTHTTWSDMVSTASNRRAFIASIKSFMAQYGFMGKH
jgi:chitinase